MRVNGQVGAGYNDKRTLYKSTTYLYMIGMYSSKGSGSLYI